MTYVEPEGAYWHIESINLSHEEPERAFTNYALVAEDTAELTDKIGELLARQCPNADGNVYALHIRRYPQPIDGAHVYDEQYRLPAAQGEAYQYRTAFQALSHRYRELEAAKQKLEDGADREEQILEKRNAALAARIELLEGRLAMIEWRAKRDLECCVGMDPEVVLGIVNGRADEENALSIDALREKLADILPTEPMPEKFDSDNQYKAALAEWGVYEQVAGILGVTLPVVADGE